MDLRRARNDAEPSVFGGLASARYSHRVVVVDATKHGQSSKLTTANATLPDEAFGISARDYQR